jgi:hypothetical protein
MPACSRSASALACHVARRPAATRPLHLGPPCLNLPPPSAAPAAPAAAAAAAAAPASPPASLHSPTHHHHHHLSRSLSTHPLLRARRSPSAQPVCFAFYPPASFLFSFGRCHRAAASPPPHPIQQRPSISPHAAAHCRSVAPFARRRLSTSMPLIVHCQSALLSLTPGLSDAASLTSARQC